MENRYKISYDLKTKSVFSIRFKQGDIDSSVLEVTLLDNRIPVDLTEEIIEFRFLKSDNTVVFQDHTTGVNILDGVNGKVECILMSNTLAIAGVVKCEIHRSQNSKRLTIPTFNFSVESSIENGKVSTNYISSIENQLILIKDAESNRAIAENARLSAETIRITNEDTRRSNEFIRVNDEVIRISSEVARASSEDIRKSNETERIDNEVIRVNSENTRKENETTRLANENIRESNETERQTIYNDLNAVKNGETKRVTNETNRLANETIRVNNEVNRVATEVTRVNSESSRVSSENTRNINESARVTVENIRKANEVTRQSNETDRTNRFTQLTTAQQQASEVVNARTSTSKAKTFPALTDRIEDVEKDIVTQSYSELLTQNTSMFNVGTGKNSSNASVDVSSSVVVGNLKIDTIYGETQKNEIINGNFANGTTGWSASNHSSFTTNINVLSVTGSGTGLPIYAFQTTNIMLPTSKKYYFQAKMRVTNTNCISLKMRIKGTTTGDTNDIDVQINPVQNQWYTKSISIITDGTWSGNLQARLSHSYIDLTTANGKVMEVKEVMLIDLTAKYGAGNEPTQAWCDANLSYFDGIKSVGEDYGGAGVHKIEVLSRGKNLFDGQWWNGYNFNKTVSPNAISPLNLSIGSLGEIYIISYSSIKSNSTIKFNTYDRNKQIIRQNQSGNSLTLQSSEVYFDFFIYNTLGIIPTDISNVLVEKGSTSTIYVPYQEDKINILMQNPLRRISATVFDNISGGVVNRNISNWVELGGNLGWTVSSGGGTGFKAISMTSIVATYALMMRSLVIKYTGYTLPFLDPLTTSDQFRASGSGNLILSIGNTDTGFVDSYSPTSAELSAYFYGWKMCKSDGSTWDGVATKYWKKITDGTGITSTLPTASYAGYTPYKMLYQLATPSVEQINVETSKPNEPTGFMPLVCYEKGSVVINSGIVPTFKYSVPLNLKATVMDNNSQLKSIKDYVYKLDSFTTAYLLSLETRVTVLESK